MKFGGKWFVVRVLWVLFGFGAGLSMANDDFLQDFSWRVVPMEFFLGVTVMFLVLSVNHWLWGNAWTWSRPSWNASPFGWLQPWQFFHVMAFQLAAVGVGRILAGPIQGPASYDESSRASWREQQEGAPCSAKTMTMPLVWC